MSLKEINNYNIKNKHFLTPAKYEFDFEKKLNH